jgi:hypothetical protein
MLSPRASSWRPRKIVILNGAASNQASPRMLSARVKWTALGEP